MLTHRPTLRSSRWIPLVLVAALAALALNLVTPSSIHAGPTGNLTVSKVIDNGQPGADPGIFDLFVSGVLQANNVFDFDNLPGVIDGSTPSVIVAPGVISFHEGRRVRHQPRQLHHQRRLHRRPGRPAP